MHSYFNEMKCLYYSQRMQAKSPFPARNHDLCLVVFSFRVTRPSLQVSDEGKLLQNNFHKECDYRKRMTWHLVHLRSGVP